jgi:hypothetical protein
VSTGLFPSIAFRLALILAASRQQETARTLEYLAGIESRLGAVETRSDALISWAGAIANRGGFASPPEPQRASLTVLQGGRSA